MHRRREDKREKFGEILLGLFSLVKVINSQKRKVDVDKVRQLGQQGLTELEGGHNDLQVLGAEHSGHLGGKEGRIENLLQELRLCGHHHPEHGLQGGLSYPRTCTGGIDLQEDREQDPGELSC